MNEKKRENVGIHMYLLDKIDALVKDGEFNNRAWAVNYIIRWWFDNRQPELDIDELRASVEKNRKRLDEILSEKIE